MTKEKTRRLVFVLLILAAGILSLMNIDSGYFIGGDGALYIEQAQHIISGTTVELFNENKYSMDHSDRHIGPYLYPIGFPLILVPVYTIFGLNFIAFKYVIVIFFLASLILLSKFFKTKFANANYLNVFVACFALNQTFLNFNEFILADIPFLFFVILSFILIEIWHQSSVFWQQALLGLIIALSYTIKHAGVIVLISLFSYHIIADFATIKKMKLTYLKTYWIKFIPYLVFIIWINFINQIYIDGSQNHLELLRSISISSAFSNLFFYIIEISKFIVSAHYIPGRILFLILLPVIIVGLITNFKRYRLYIIFITLNLGLYSLWPSRQDIRFLFPVLPFILFFLIEGSAYLAVRLSIKQIYFLPYLILFIIAIQGFVYSYRDISKTNSTNLLSDSSIEAFDFIKKSSVESDIIIFSRPRTMRLMTNRNSVSLSNPENIRNANGRFYTTYRLNKVNYEGLDLKFENDDFRIYEIIKN